LTAELRRRLQRVAQDRVTCTGEPENPRRDHPIKKAAIGLAAMWGRLTHRLPIKVARQLALRISSDADQPAMFTIIFGVGLVLTTYAVCVVIVGSLAHSVWFASLCLASLLVGAYWAAFEPHVKR
jgi:hypothetical protein